MGKLHRLHIELALAVVSGVLGVASIAAPDWFELVTGWDPDHRSGRLEWFVTVISMATAVAAAVSAYEHHRRRLPPRDM